MDDRQKDIVVIGAGYGGITAALRTARLFRGRPDIRVHLVDRNPYLCRCGGGGAETVFTAGLG